MMRAMRPITLFLLTSVGCYMVFHLFAALMRPELASTRIDRPLEVVERIAAEREVDLEQAGSPVLWVDVDYSEGEAAGWFPKGEPPVAAELVAEGKLPPVAERVGPEPMVMRGAEGIGRYGGALYQNTYNESLLRPWIGDMSSERLVRWSPTGYPIVPAVARAWESNADKSVWRFHLRKGLRWSDGHPMTASDILFWWETSTCRGENLWLSWMNVRGRRGEVVRIDDLTVEFRFPSPYGSFLEKLGKEAHILPEHYLRPYHDILGEPEAWEKGMKEFGVPTPRALYIKAQDFFNPERPVLTAWAYRTYRTNPPYRFVRNPYYYGVDEEGNQLPYIDSVMVDLVTPELLAINASTGRLSFQSRLVKFDDYTILMENREKYGYRVLHWYQGLRSMWSLFPNINRAPDENKPMEVFKAAILKERAFRQALSLAIDREDIIDTLYGGVGHPGQLAPGKGSPFHSPELEQAYAQFDPVRANSLLDGIGLTRRDSKGFRTTPDGDYLVFFIEYENFTGIGPAQFIVDDWAEVGIRAVYRERARAQYYSRKRALKHDITVYTGESEFIPLVEARSFVPINAEAHFAIQHAIWYTQGGMSGDPNAEAMGGLPPAEGSAVMRAFELYEDAIAAGTLEEQVERFQRIFDINAEEVWSISIMPSPFQPVVAHRDLRNVPDLALFGFFFRAPGNASPELFYWDDPVESPGMHEKLKEAMVTVTMPPRVAAIRSESSGLVGGVIRFLLGGILIAAVILVGIRHPYVGKRLALMIPTLAIISVIVFTVIRLPPSNFVETRILELQAQGQSAAALQEVEELKTLFHLDESVVSQFLRWSGFYWFRSFDANDRGLLQGDLGRSMENTVRVNEIVGDRVILTLVISLGTILFTWVLAIPIGIYSAVRQYSVFDYVLTFSGFIGMCIPPFLLALILMYFSTDVLGIDAIGLFSPEYAAQPVWTWGKVVDLLKHLWVPILVLGLGGTTGMIRVMRGNLLDELRKPYVVTARAKGVPPLKLLLKYPFRLALNPFVSGIGALFPQLISGGAIVAVVLGIPTVGPLMLNSLMTEDTYMAGSLLMVLSLLGIFGMLASDLLLAWLDPRIRMDN